MDDHISWLFEVAVKPGQLDDFKALLAEMVESTRTEPGALVYQLSISDDGSAVHLYERYADSVAVLAHVGTFGERFAGRFLAAVDPTRFVVYGSASDEVKEALAAFGPAYMTPFGGFARH